MSIPKSPAYAYRGVLSSLHDGRTKSEKGRERREAAKISAEKWPVPRGSRLSLKGVERETFYSSYNNYPQWSTRRENDEQPFRRFRLLRGICTFAPFFPPSSSPFFLFPRSRSLPRSFLIPERAGGTSLSSGLHGFGMRFATVRWAEGGVLYGIFYQGGFLYFVETPVRYFQSFRFPSGDSVLVSYIEDSAFTVIY